MLTLKELSSQPVRFGLYKDKKLLLSLSSKTRKNFELEPGENVPEELLPEVAKFESALITSQMEYYLSASEKSPANLDNWLYKRRLAPEVEAALKACARESGFLSEERYAELFLEKEQRRGGKSLSLIRKELKYKGISDPVLKGLVFDDKKSLEQALKNNSRLRQAGRTKLVQRFLARGFRYEDIKKMLDKL